MSSKRTVLKVGQKVRARRADYHYAKFGAIGTVRRVGMWDVDVEFPVGALGDPDAFSTQAIEHADLLHAPQANRSNAA
jgi:hypothetical protein